MPTEGDGHNAAHTPGLVVDEFMIVCFKHGHVGNSYLFWRPDGAGYTEIVEEAGVYTREGADQRVCDGNVMVPRSFVKSNTLSVLDSQRVSKSQILAAASKARAEGGAA